MVHTDGGCAVRLWLNIAVNADLITDEVKIMMEEVARGTLLTLRRKEGKH